MKRIGKKRLMAGQDHHRLRPKSARRRLVARLLLVTGVIACLGAAESMFDPDSRWSSSRWSSISSAHADDDQDDDRRGIFRGNRGDDDNRRGWGTDRDRDGDRSGRGNDDDDDDDDGRNRLGNDDDDEDSGNRNRKWWGGDRRDGRSGGDDNDE
jgi:hypothetical protein